MCCEDYAALFKTLCLVCFPRAIRGRTVGWPSRMVSRRHLSQSGHAAAIVIGFYLDNPMSCALRQRTFPVSSYTMMLNPSLGAGGTK